MRRDDVEVAVEDQHRDVRIGGAGRGGRIGRRRRGPAQAAVDELVLVERGEPHVAWRTVRTRRRAAKRAPRRSWARRARRTARRRPRSSGSRGRRPPHRRPRSRTSTGPASTALRSSAASRSSGAGSPGVEGAGGGEELAVDRVAVARVVDELARTPRRPSGRGAGRRRRRARGRSSGARREARRQRAELGDGVRPTGSVAERSQTAVQAARIASVVVRPHGSKPSTAKAASSTTALDALGVADGERLREVGPVGVAVEARPRGRRARRAPRRGRRRPRRSRRRRRRRRAARRSGRPRARSCPCRPAAAGSRSRPSGPSRGCPSGSGRACAAAGASRNS